MGDNSEKYIPELFDKPCVQFSEHLNKEDNTRIIFSGKFGIGKTYFLERFFSSEVQLEKLGQVRYNAFHIFPVNYSISPTEDIFRFLKYDIIDALMVKGVQVEDQDYAFIDALPAYVSNNKWKIFSSILKFIPKLGKGIDEIMKLSEKFEAEIKGYKNEVKVIEGAVFSDFQHSVEAENTSLIIDDIVVTLINKVLQRQAEKTNCENILIIDDLDRIDPEHVFRILNVFSAHLNFSKLKPPKLLFDKIVIVCDVVNLRSIFKANYGGKADFNGYIDKFYSHDIFNLDNKNAIRTICKTAFLSVNIEETNTPKQAKELLGYFTREESLPIDILETLVSHQLVNLRTLIKVVDYPIVLNTDRKLFFSDEYPESISRFPLLFNFLVLKQIVGGFENLHELIVQVPSVAWKIPRREYYFNQLLYFTYFKETMIYKRLTVVDHRTQLFKCPAIDRNLEAFKRIIVTKMKPGISYDSVGDEQYRCNEKEIIELLLDFLQVLSVAELEGD